MTIIKKTVQEIGGGTVKNSPEAELNRPVSELLPLFPIDLDHPQVKFRDGDYHLAFLNPDYFDRKLPHHIPQFIAIQSNIRTMADPPAWERRFGDSISNRLDFTATRALLGETVMGSNAPPLNRSLRALSP